VLGITRAVAFHGAVMDIGVAPRMAPLIECEELSRVAGARIRSI
jgi:hypothetical protein